MTKSFPIKITGIDYHIDVYDNGFDVEVYVDREDDDTELEEEEMAVVINYLINEGFVRKPK